MSMWKQASAKWLSWKELRDAKSDFPTWLSLSSLAFKHKPHFLLYIILIVSG